MSTLHRNPPPQLEYTSDDSWTALSIGRRYGTLFVASTSTELSVCRQPGPADVSPRQFSSLPCFSLVAFRQYVPDRISGPALPHAFPPLLSAPRWPLPPTLRSPNQPIGPFRYCTVYRPGSITCKTPPPPNFVWNLYR